MLFIAEIGLNHNGSFSLACEMIRQAKLCGADVAKFQIGWRGKEGELNHITPEILDNLIRWCEYVGIEPLASIFTPEAWAMARTRPFKRYKIASRTVVDHPDLAQTIIAEGKETIVSLGMWSGPGLPFSASNIRYLWCRSLYPTAPWQLLDLPKNFRESQYTGYSDHFLGIESALVAITRGARIVEKHFTLDKSDVTIRDHALSATPDEFKTLVQLGRGIARLCDLGG